MRSKASPPAAARWMRRAISTHSWPSPAAENRSTEDLAGTSALLPGNPGGALAPGNAGVSPASGVPPSGEDASAPVSKTKRWTRASRRPPAVPASTASSRSRSITAPSPSSDPSHSSVSWSPAATVASTSRLRAASARKSATWLALRSGRSSHSDPGGTATCSPSTATTAERSTVAGSANPKRAISSSNR